MSNNSLSEYFIKFFRLFFSFPCPICERNESRSAICGTCCKKLISPSANFCPGCGGELDGILNLCTKCLPFGSRPWDNAFTLFQLSGEGHHLVHRFKYYSTPELARSFALLAYGKIVASQEVFDVVTPIPLYITRKWHRGYNQAQLFGEELAKLLNIKATNLLTRTKNTKQQALLNRQKRQKNIKGAFELKPNADLCKYKRILLVDDVMTTGATLTEATKVLQTKFNGCITVFTIGRR